MRKTIINPDTINPRPHSQGEWLDLGEIATVEVTSEDPNFPIEFALTAREGSGWRAAARGKQMIRIVLDRPRPVRRIRLEFSETESQRTQEFTLRWSQAGGHSEKCSPAMELQSARLNQRARRLSGPVGESLGLGVDSQARPYAGHRIRNFGRVARVINANGERSPPKACARSRELLLGRRAKLAWSLLGDLRSPSLDSRGRELESP